MEKSDKTLPDTNSIAVAASASSMRARAAQRAEEQAKRKADKQRRLLFILFSVAVVLNAMLAYFLYGVLIQRVELENQQALIDQELNVRSRPAQLFLSTRQEKLDAMARQPEVIQAFAEKNKDSLSTLMNALSAQVEDTLAVKYFLPGEADLDQDTVVPIRYAELDFIRRTERRDPHLPEAALIKDQWQIHFTVPVVADKDQPVLGVLLLAVDAKKLAAAFKTGQVVLGEAVLQQRFVNSPAQAIFKEGTANSYKSQEKEISNSNWQIKFTPSDNLMEAASASLTLYLMIVGGCTALCFALAIVLSRKFTKDEKSTDEEFVPAVPAIKKAKPANSTDEALPGTLYQNQDIFDIAVIGDDENILGLHDTSKKKLSAEEKMAVEKDIPSHIFRSYDIRGIVGSDLNETLAEKIGQAIGSEVLDQGHQSIVVARDGRLHSQDLTNGLIRGILRTGCNVINIGVVPTPLMYFATYHFNDVCNGVVVTASHNPAEYNGFKIVINNHALSDDAIVSLRDRILAEHFHQGIGEESFREIIPHYIERIFSDVALASNVSMVVDAGNAVTGLVAPQLFEELGCEVTALYCDLDGSFPNHDPDPTQEKNLKALINKVREVNADIGVAFDGDGDRLVVVTPKGDIIWPDRLLMLFARDILARHPGADVLFDVKCSRQLHQVVSSYGGRPVMWKTGHSPMKAKMVETGALIGGEYSGHIFIKDRWYGFDDGIYAMARLLEIITLRDQKIDDVFAAFPPLIVTPEIKVAVSDQLKFELIKKLAEKGDFQTGTITSIDGIRVDFPKGWGLVRASNTSPALTLRFEAETQEFLEKIQQLFKRELLKIDSNLKLNF